MDTFAQMASLANNQIPQGYEQQDEQSPGGGKRRAEDGQPQQRAKRNRYISIACNGKPNLGWNNTEKADGELQSASDERSNAMDSLRARDAAT